MNRQIDRLLAMADAELGQAFKNYLIDSNDQGWQGYPPDRPEYQHRPGVGDPVHEGLVSASLTPVDPLRRVFFAS